ILALRSPSCLLTYAALGEGIGTAPGQLTLGEMRQTYRAGRLQPRTRVFGLLGPHTEAERLAEYNAWFAADAFDGVAVPFVGEAAAAAIVGAFRELPVSGWHLHGDGANRQDAASAADGQDAAGAADRQNAPVRADRQDAAGAPNAGDAREAEETQRAQSAEVAVPAHHAPSLAIHETQCTHNAAHT